MPELKTQSATLYDTDYQVWLEQTLKQLRSRHFDELDLENLIEELASLGKRDKRAIASYLMRLCEHLLKVKYWQSECTTALRGWNVEIRNFRLQIQSLLADSPSLSNHLQENFVTAYQNGRNLMLDASELSPTIVPEQPCFTLAQALDVEWRPLV
ncbi:MAG: DUF29 domain-containing protein [Cyanobacteria bacterium P01_H01_bin.121]